jgi:hypothetical protein
VCTRSVPAKPIAIPRILLYTVSLQRGYTVQAFHALRPTLPLSGEKYTSFVSHLVCIWMRQRLVRSIRYTFLISHRLIATPYLRHQQIIPRTWTKIGLSTSGYCTEQQNCLRHQDYFDWKASSHLDERMSTTPRISKRLYLLHHVARPASPRSNHAECSASSISRFPIPQLSSHQS